MVETYDRIPGEHEERGRALVLAVDDEPIILSEWSRVLAELPIRLRCLESAEEALQAMLVETPAVLVSDHRMSGMTGLDLIERIQKKWPAVRLALYTSDPIAQSRASRLRVPFVEKGATPQTLRSLVVGLLGAASPGNDG